MKRVIPAVIFIVFLTSCGRIKHENGRHIVLPNSKLLGCRSSDCSQLWQDKPADVNAIYPRQVIVDLLSNKSTPCPFGVTALYEKSVSMDDLKATIDERYGKWAQAGNTSQPVKLWRVEPRKFAIQLAVTDDRTKGVTPEQSLAQALGQSLGYGERSDVAEAGMKQVIYIAFAGTKCGAQ
jgi:hypothetical protein